jgi:pimeloyl-ACP methyl ester carboxylesterase
MPPGGVRIGEPLPQPTALLRSRRRFQGSRLALLPGAGHVCNIEAAEEFNRTVRDFLRDAS